MDINNTITNGTEWGYLPGIRPEVHYIVGCLLAAVGTAGVLGNALVLFVFTRFRRLRGPFSSFIVNLAVADLCTSLLHYMVVVSSFQGRWVFGQLGCKLYAGGVGHFGLLSIVTLAAIAVERYWVITAKPLSGSRKMTKYCARKVCALAWLYCLAMSLPPFFGWSRYVPEGFFTSCSWDYTTRTLANRLYYVYLLALGFVIPVSVITYCYAFIMVAILAHGREMKDVKANALSHGIGYTCIYAFANALRKNVMGPDDIDDYRDYFSTGSDDTPPSPLPTRLVMAYALYPATKSRSTTRCTEEDTGITDDYSDDESNANNERACRMYYTMKGRKRMPWHDVIRTPANTTTTLSYTVVLDVLRWFLVTRRDEQMNVFGRSARTKRRPGTMFVVKDCAFLRLFVIPTMAERLLPDEGRILKYIFGLLTLDPSGNIGDVARPDNTPFLSIFEADEYAKRLTAVNFFVGREVTLAIDPDRLDRTQAMYLNSIRQRRYAKLCIINILNDYISDTVDFTALCRNVKRFGLADCLRLE